MRKRFRPSIASATSRLALRGRVLTARQARFPVSSRTRHTRPPVAADTSGNADPSKTFGRAEIVILFQRQLLSCGCSIHIGSESFDFFRWGERIIRFDSEASVPFKVFPGTERSGD